MPGSRPTTPSGDNRRISRRHSRRSSGSFPPQSPHHYPIDADNLPMDSPDIVEKFRDIADQMEDLDVNMRDLSHIHSAISSQFNESFASFLYGLSITMWCVDFPTIPSRAEWERIEMKEKKREELVSMRQKLADAERLNGELKTRLAEESRSTPGGAGMGIGAIREKKKRPVARANHTPEPDYLGKSANFANNRKSRIPQPINRPVTASTATVSVIPTTSTRSMGKTGPNLNQPPRYMQGLFENNLTNSRVTKTGMTATQKKPMKTTQRPPFR
ncbi:DAM1 [Candida oxycetoniae]|uniref:DASH complex subunit DAM1 n=1 Tax=Candida oxycetoniae TaxID=497107 RepID=A0AAI9WVZ8_9ASCO|nr:DAM1 [Candida oxycetoniae]KAI3402710.2 DAM1 [Candida oxycetoniae]